MQPAPDDRTQDWFVPLHADSLHDLSSPVNQISTMLELYLNRRPHSRSPEDELILKLIQTSAGRLQKLVTALRDYARVAGPNREVRSCDCNALLGTALASLDPAVRETGARVTRADLPWVECDPGQLIYAFTCLVDNALKFRGEACPEVQISAAGDGADWIFSVRDNGIGIEPRHRESVFHMFKRIHGNSYDGCGAGLAITRQIIEQHGGRIWFESEPGHGSTFRFTLPRS